MIILSRRFAGKIIRNIKSRFNPLKWKIQARFIRLTSSKSVKLLPIDNSKKYLILAPHSDDEWIGASQIMLNCPKTIICNMDMQGGDSEEVHKLRYSEMLSVSSKFNCKLVTLVGEKVNSLLSIIQCENPDYVLLPHFIDWHPEHIEVMGYLRKIILDGLYSNDVLTYQVSVPFLNRNNCFYYPMSKETQLNKWSVFMDYYKTQNFMPIGRFIANEMVNGVEISEVSAEIYKRYCAAKWIEEFDDFEMRIKDRRILSKHINNLVDIRKFIFDICH